MAAAATVSASCAVAPAVDLPAAERAVADLLRALGRDPDAEHLADTPRRVADAYAELLTSPPFDLTTFPNDEGYNELVLARDIPVQSLCEHHLLPFTGRRAHRLPARRADPRPVEAGPGASSCSPATCRCRSGSPSRWPTGCRRTWHPRGVGVVIEAEHLCMSLRGVRATGSRTTTSALHGLLREDARSRAGVLRPRRLAA